MEISSYKWSMVKQKTNFYQQILDHIPALVYINTYTEPDNPQSLINEWSNRYTYEFFGYSKEEIASMGYSFFLEILHPDDLNLIKTTVNASTPQQEGTEYAFLQ